MSVSLDALKKLEQEKLSSRSGPVDIVPGMVNRQVTREDKGYRRITLLITGAVAVTAVVTFFAMGGGRTGMQRPVPLASGPVANLPEPLPVPQTGKQVSQPAVRSGNTPEPALTPTADLLPRRRQSKALASQGSDGLSQGAGSSSPSTLKVSGIAWQEERLDRRAVVNGVLAAEGEVIEGARIVLIDQERVRFSRGGDTFEVAVSGR
jgi:general secretion pathway protein B